VVSYDAAHGSELVPTLDAFLRADGSWSRCAEAMRLHVNTVRYRISRVEEVTGRDLNRLEDRVDMLLALRSLPLKR
jgi:DNA-binding PucR family transcriptional regulator